MEIPKPTDTDRDRFRADVARLSDVGSVGTPVWRGGRRFWLYAAPGQEHPVLRTRAADGSEATLVDPVALDPTGATTLDAWHPDRDGTRLAYQLSRGGAEHAELYVRDVATGALRDGPVDRCRYSPVVWLPGGAEFYYVRGDGVRHRRVYLHRVGTPATDDVPVFGDGHDEGTGYGLGGSDDGRWLLVAAYADTGTRNSL